MDVYRFIYQGIVPQSPLFSLWTYRFIHLAWHATVVSFSRAMPRLQRQGCSSRLAPFFERAVMAVPHVPRGAVDMYSIGLLSVALFFNQSDL